MRTLTRVMLLAIAAAGCAPKRPTVRPVAPPAPQAPVAPPLPGYILPRTQRLTLGVMPFLDQTKRSEVAQLELADILTTELFQTGRFELVDRQQYKEDVKRTSSTTTRISPGGADGQARTTSTTSTETFGWGCSDSCKAYDILDITSYVKNVTGGSAVIDALLLGYVTGVDTRERGGTLHIDFRIVSFAKQKLTGKLGDTDNLILYAGAAELDFTGALPGGPIEIRREGERSVTGVAKQIASVFPPALVPSAINVVSQVDVAQGTYALAAGLKSNIRLGLEGYVVEKETPGGILKYIAAFSVIAVFPETSIIAIYYPDRFREVVGKPVVFK